MLSLSLLLLVLPLSLGRAAGWPAWTWVCLSGSAPVFAAFIVIQRRVARRGGSPLVKVQVIAARPVLWGLATLMAATGTYYALLFTLAQYLQQGLGDSALLSGLTLVPWVAAFGLAGQIVRRLPARLVRRAPAGGCLLLTAAYAAISITLFTGYHGEVLLIALLSLGGLGLGVQFSALIGHLTTAVPSDYAPDISGVSTTGMQIGGAVAVAAFGTLYLGLEPTGAADATHAFAITTSAFAAVALLATAMARRAVVFRGFPQRAREDLNL